MAVETVPPPFKPRGNSIAWDQAAWLLLLSITDDDYTAAISLFEQHVAQAYRGIITGDGWTFDKQDAQYVRRNGKPLKSGDLKSIMLLFTLSIAHDLQDDAEAMVRGDTTIGDWQTAAAAKIKSTYIASAMVGAGGRDNFDEVDAKNTIGAPTEDRTVPEGIIDPDATPGGLADALTRLQDFAVGVETGAARANTSAIVIYRAGLYTGPANTMYEDALRNANIKRLDDDLNALEMEERNVLDDAAEHCSTNEYTEGCPECTEAGWVPIGTLPLPGLRTCGSNCHCGMSYRIKPKSSP
jgi:hypothetical protein